MLVWWEIGLDENLMAMKLCHQPSKVSTIDGNWWFCAIFVVFCFMVCFLQVMKSGCFCCDDNQHFIFIFFVIFHWWRGDGVFELDLEDTNDGYWEHCGIVGSTLVKGGISFHCGFWCWSFWSLVDLLELLWEECPLLKT